MLTSSLPRSAMSACLLLDHARTAGLGEDACLAGTSLRRQDLHDQTREISSAQEERVIRNIVGLVGPDADFAVRAGAAYRLEMFGMLGFACLSARTRREMTEIALRYQDLAFTLARARMLAAHGHTYITLDTSHLCEDVRQFAVDQCFATVWMIMATMDGSPPPGRLETRRRRPAGGDPYGSLPHTTVTYSAPADRISFPDSYLDQPKPSVDADALKLCLDTCQELIARRRERIGMAGSVRERLQRASGRAPSMDQVAADLTMSVRSLHRALADEGSSFRQIEQEVRRLRSATLLRETTRTVDEISIELGYAAPPAFTRAFRRWYGTSPILWRRTELGEADQAHSIAEPR